MVRTNSRRVLVVAAVAGVLLSAAAEAYGAEEKLGVVQNRKYKLAHELSFFPVGVLALDPFTKGIAFGGSYSIHFTNHFAWEIARFDWMLGVKTDLRDQLERNFGIYESEFTVTRWIATSNLLLSPWYGKFTVFNSKLLYMDLGFSLGGGVAMSANAGPILGENLDRDINPVVEVGLVWRFFLGKVASLRFDFKNLVFLDFDLQPEFNFDATYDIYLGLGLSLNMGSS